MARTIQITLPDISEKRQNYVLEALKEHEIDASIEGNKLTFAVANEAADSLVCMVGVMIGVNMCKMF